MRWPPVTFDARDGELVGDIGNGAQLLGLVIPPHMRGTTE
jgi:hypothetical protein